MLRLTLLRMRFNCFTEIRRGYLSNEFKNTIKSFPINQPENSSGVLPIVVNSFVTGDFKYSEASEKFLKLRSIPRHSFAFEITNFAIIRHFIDIGAVEELIPILGDPLNCGIFLDHFTGCYLLNNLLRAKNFNAAAEIGVQIFAQGILDNQLVAVLTLKSFIGYLEQESVTSEDSVKPLEEKKVRVKFIRNIDANCDMKATIGKAMNKIAEICPKDVKINCQVLGYLLENKQGLFLTALHANGSNLCPDILTICARFAQNKCNGDEKVLNTVKLLLKECLNRESFKNLVSSFLKQAQKDEEEKCISKQKQLYNAWNQQQLSKEILDIENAVIEKRKQNLNKILNDIAVNKQKLWYFEIEDNIDLEIFKKNKSYPKRWFGKKKKARVVDNNYIPPEIMTKIQLLT